METSTIKLGTRSHTWSGMVAWEIEQNTKTTVKFKKNKDFFVDIFEIVFSQKLNQVMIEDFNKLHLSMKTPDRLTVFGSNLILIDFKGLNFPGQPKRQQSFPLILLRLPASESP